MRILGVDPGTRRCGYGVVDVEGRRLRYVECGVIEPPASAPMHERLAELASSLAEVIGELKPDVVAVEDVFHGIDARSALKLGQARGVVLAAAGGARLPLAEYPPATVKRSVTGQGAAAKAQVGAVVRALLSLRRVPAADAADALAVAICHAHHAPARALLERAAAASAAAARVVRRARAKASQ